MKRPLRIVSYAINGRGMGHLVRQLAIARQVRLLTGVLGVPVEQWVLTSSEADTLARREGFVSLKMPSKAMMRDAGIDPHRYLTIARTWVLQTIAGLQPDILVVDTFPGGSFGELVAALELVPHRVLVARRVRESFAEQDTYQALLPMYQRIVVPDASGCGPILLREPHETLAREEARRALGLTDQRAVYVTLGGGGDLDAATLLPKLIRMLHERDWHVVVGAGPLYDGEELRGPGITWLSRYTPVELLAGVDAAVAAAGYNTFHELMSAGVPTVFLPLSRIADDQTERARRAEAAGGARVASRIEDIPDLLEDPGTREGASSLVPLGGARRAAVDVLSTMLPTEDLKMAQSMLTPRLVRLLADRTASAKDAMALVRALSGGTPAEWSTRRAVLTELQQRGHDVPEVEPPDVEARLDRLTRICEAHSLTLSRATYLVTTLDRKFPAAGGGDILHALEILVPVWSTFEDWMGVVSLLRAVPTQRTLTLEAFAHAQAAWLTQEEDLFDALRDFTRLEGSGERPVAEVLHVLARESA